MLSAVKSDEKFLNKSMDWNFPIPIAYGPGRLNEISDILQQIQNI